MKRLVPLIVIAACSLPLLAGCGAASGVAPVARATVKAPQKTGAKAATPTRPVAPTLPAQSGGGRPFITQLGADAPAFSPKGDQLIFETPKGLTLAQPNGQGARVLHGTRADDRSPAWSPDGASLVFVRSNGDRGSALMRFSLTNGQVSPIHETTEAVRAVTFSPDGRTLAYLAGSDAEVALYRLALPGNTPTRLWKGAAAGALTVTASQHVIFDFKSDTGAQALAMVPLGGGTVEKLAVAGTNPRFPRMSPTGRSLAYVADDGLYVAQPNGQGARRLAPGDGLSHPTWNPTVAQVVVAAPRGSRPDLQVVTLPTR
jgi:dipeptidyl aminopeptidase/acylaminoacyl peptidase